MLGHLVIKNITRYYVNVNVKHITVRALLGLRWKAYCRAMPRFIIQALAAALGFWIASKLLHGVRVDGPESLLLAGLLLGIVNALVRPVLVILTLPLTILTLGLFLLAVNGITVWIVTLFIHGVHIRGPMHAIFTALIISVTSWIVGGILHPETRRW